MSELFNDLHAGLVLPHELQTEREGRLRAEGARDVLTAIVERQLAREQSPEVEQTSARPQHLRSVS